MDANSRLTIEDKETGAAVTSTWLLGATEVMWPSELPVRNGAKYRVSLDVSPRPIELDLHVGGADLTEPAAKIAWMREVGCQRQALQMLAALVQ